MNNVLSSVSVTDRAINGVEPIRLDVGLEGRGVMMTQSDEEFFRESGKFRLDVLTLARASQEGVPTRPEAQYVCVIHADTGKNMPIAFTSIQNVRAFIREFQPRAVVVMVGHGESPERIADHLGPKR